LDDSKDILTWSDLFWCFRSECQSDRLRDGTYRVIANGSEEWRAIAGFKFVPTTQMTATM
jgi:hypothetical protein